MHYLLSLIQQKRIFCPDPGGKVHYFCPDPAEKECTIQES
jgi:hypothetical protein